MLDKYVYVDKPIDVFLRSDSLNSQSPPCYHFLFTRIESGEKQAYFWNAILGIRRAGFWFPSEVKE